MEQYRTGGGSEATPFSPNMVREAFELQEQREQEKVQKREREQRGESSKGSICEGQEAARGPEEA